MAGEAFAFTAQINSDGTDRPFTSRSRYPFLRSYGGNRTPRFVEHCKISHLLDATTGVLLCANPATRHVMTHPCMPGRSQNTKIQKNRPTARTLVKPSRNAAYTPRCRILITKASCAEKSINVNHTCRNCTHSRGMSILRFNLPPGVRGTLTRPAEWFSSPMSSSYASLSRAK